MISWKKLKKIPNNIAILVIKIYRIILSPSVGILGKTGLVKPSCIFYPTCSEYALLCFEKYELLEASRKTIDRISRCNHKNTPSVDLP